MNREAATNLICSTFEQPFEEERYRYFMRELLNQIDESKAQSQAGAYIADAFKPYVRLIKRLGTYTGPDQKQIDLLVVYLKTETSLDRARTMQRNLVAHHLKKRGKEAALVAYASPDLQDWRFSLVRLEFQLDVDEKTGKVKLDEDLTPSKRYSFLVGANEPNHTAQQQLIDILANDAENPSLDALEKAFNIEVVTKKFFDDYKERFLELKEALDQLVKQKSQTAAIFSPEDLTTSNFAKRLMGQIVFLYFLQKKGWLGVRGDQPGPKDFLRQLFEKEWRPYQNFFNDILEPLFYEALAVEHPDHFYQPLQCKIPFLNGGLFEPPASYDWRATPLPLPDEVFGKILDTFDLYNFTVREDEPLEKEIAVDPEMLGKVFERLLEVQDRKSKGAFYTPREIVHYMCQESLVYYLDSALNYRLDPLARVEPVQEELFGALKARQAAMTSLQYHPIVQREDLDMLIRQGETTQEFDQARQAGTKSYKPKLRESVIKNAEKIDQALAEVKICDPAIGSGAFPVGMMQEIVRARQVLSTYLGAGSANRSTYELKRHAIQNSLYGVDIDPGAVDIAKLRLWLSLVVDEQDFTQVKPLPNLDYKIVCGDSLIGFPENWGSVFEQEIQSLIHQHFNETNPIKKRQLKIQIDEKIDARYRNSIKAFGYHVTFDFRTVFSEVFHQNDGFDVVIANPPYVRQEEIKELKKTLKKQFDCYTGTSDLFVYFFEKGLRLLKQNGILTFISSNKYFRSNYGEKLRKLLGEKTNILRIIDFGDTPVFEAIAYPSILSTQTIKPDGNKFAALPWREKDPVEKFREIIQSQTFLMSQKDLSCDGWRLEKKIVLDLVEKLGKFGKPLSQYSNGGLYRGIITGLNNVLIVDRDKYEELVSRDSSSALIMKPILRGRDIKRWQIDYGNLYLIKIESSENKNHPWTGKSYKEAEQIFSRTYPTVFQHLRKYKENLVKRDDQGKFYWELRSCSYWDIFEEEQIVWGNLAAQPKFALAPKGYYLSAPATSIVSNSKYLLGILNSIITRYLVSQYAAERQGGFLEYKPMYVSKLSIPDVSIEKQRPIIDLVEKILMEKQVNPQADVSTLEEEIDNIVYQLYELTGNEIDIVEGSG